MTVPRHRIHIVGTSPRSGTTLLAEMMATCFDVHAEPVEMPIHSRPDRPVDVYLTKRPRDLRVSACALRMLPNLDVVCLVRDPRDVVVSVHQADPDRYWVSLKFWNAFEPHLAALHDRDRFTIVYYEDLVRDPDREQRRLAARLPYLVPRSSFSTFETTARPSEQATLALGGLRPVSPASTGAWRDHLPRIAGQLAQHGSISDSLVRHGYEPDRAWESMVDGVEPDLRPAHWPEHFGRKQIARRRRDAMMRIALLSASERLRFGRRPHL